MKVGVIFVLHGRRNKLAQSNFTVVEKVAQKLNCPYAIGLLEGDELTLEQAIAELKVALVEQIIFLPVLLFPATHVKEDLPQRVAMQMTEKTYQILPPLGTTKAVANFALEVIQQAESIKPILLISHGTPHYEEPLNELQQLAQKIEAKVGRPVLASQYLGEASYLTVMDPLASYLILPLFLTEGFIVKKIKQAIELQRPDQEDTFLATLENSTALEQALVERLEDVLDVSGLS